MFLLWVLFFALVLIVGIILVAKCEDDSIPFNFGLFMIFIPAIVLFFQLVYAMDEYQSIKVKVTKIEALQSIINAESVLALKDLTVINNLSPDILLEKKVEYNEDIIEWQANNKFFRSGIYIPNEVNNLKLIE